MSTLFMHQYSPQHLPPSCSLSRKYSVPQEMAVERPHSSTSGTSSRSAIVEGENQVCWDIETYKLVTKRVEDLEAENRMLRSKVVVMAAENAALRERLDSEAHSRSLSQLLEQLRESNAQSDVSPSTNNHQYRSEVPSTHHCLPCDYDHVLRTQPDAETAQQQPSPQWKSPPSTQASKPMTHLDIEEPKFWDIQSVISGSLVGDRIIPQYHPKFPLLDDHSSNSYQATMWSPAPPQVLGSRLNEHGAYLTMPFAGSNTTEAVATSSQRAYNYFAERGGENGMPSPPETELAENILRRRTRRRGRRGGKKHGGRRKKQETSAM